MHITMSGPHSPGKVSPPIVSSMAKMGSKISKERNRFSLNEKYEIFGHEFIFETFLRFFHGTIDEYHNLYPPI